MVACFLLDMVYIQSMMEEDQKEGTPGSLQPFSASASFSGLLHCISRLEGLCGTGRVLGGLVLHQLRRSPDGNRSLKGQVRAERRQEQPMALPGPAQPQALTNLPSASPDHAVH